MPSGYTHKIVDGAQSFEEFLYGAVRAMNSFIHMRDDPMDAPLRLPAPDFVKKGSPDKVAKRLAEIHRYEAELRDELAKTPKEVEAEFEEHKTKQWAEYKERYARRKPIHDRVQRLRSQVADWVTPSPDHDGFKSFLLQQLDETTKWDCELPEAPVFPDTAVDYHTKKVKRLEQRIERCKELHQEEIASPDVQKDRIEWIKELVGSVPPPPGIFAEGEL